MKGTCRCCGKKTTVFPLSFLGPDYAVCEPCMKNCALGQPHREASA